MKTLTVKQPWASLICSGIKDVENRSWQPKSPPGRILIHAGGSKIPRTFNHDCLSPEEVSYVDNLKQFGIIPEYEEMPLSAIIGYVEVTGFTVNSQSMWAGKGDIHWLLENAYLFDEPISNVKGKLGLFDYPIDPDKLPPAHKIEADFPNIKGKRMTVHVCKKDWIDLLNGQKEYRINLNNKYITGCICSKESRSKLTPISSIKFVCDDQSITYQVIDAKRISRREWDGLKREALYTLGKKRESKYLFT